MCDACPVRRALVVHVIAVLALVGGCAGGAPGPAGPPASGDRSTPSAPRAPCLSQSDDGLFLTCLRTAIDGVWSREFRATGRDYRSPQLTVGPAGATAGDHERDLARDRAYFNGRSGIHFPTRYLDDVRTTHGTRAHIVLTFTLGHEIGHHVQLLLHPRFEAPDVDVETQADCYAGFWAGREAEAGRLDVEEFRSAAQAELRRLSQDPGEVRSHGSADRRIESLERGLRATAPPACDVDGLTWR